MSSYRVTLSDGTEHIIKASTAGRAHLQAYALDDFPRVSVVSVDAL
jgi:hypothetical protein